MRRFVDCAREIETAFDLTLERLSVINSSGLELIAAGGMPERINHAFQ